ncbi:hypothetical protein D9758_002710 [Tetrapyrgos nigripes]|uniref:Uncharacterized protein n=1 Tax=Tetrapyrgos nigripes TaxID=182062 RepID=A0A8H5GQK3_9AGAR|nr:hypothetical protein D9758_002710 [Tetrapyrgos nigripes]
MHSLLLLASLSAVSASVIPAKHLLLTWGSTSNIQLDSDYISPHLEQTKYLCDVFIGRTELSVVVDARSHDLDDISLDSVSRRVSEIYAQQDDITITRPPTVHCRVDPNHANDSPSRAHDHSSHSHDLDEHESQIYDPLEAQSHLSFVPQLNSPCPHSSLHKRIGYGFLNILDLLSMLGVVLLAVLASMIASFIRGRQQLKGVRGCVAYSEKNEDGDLKSSFDDTEEPDMLTPRVDLYHNQGKSHRSRSMSHNYSSSKQHQHQHHRYTSLDTYYQLPSGDEAMKYLDGKLQ